MRRDSCLMLTKGTRPTTVERLRSSAAWSSALFLVISALVLASTACGTEPTEPACDGGKASGVAACVKQSEYVSDLTFVAKPRPTGSTHHAAVKKMLIERLTKLGYTVSEQKYGLGTNIIGEKKGTKKADEIVIVGGHYDGVPDCAAADDNATAVAGALQVASAIARYPHERTIQIVFWDEEERGWVGSYHHAAQLAAQKKKVVAVYDFEMIGFRSDVADSQQLPGGFNVIFPVVGKYWLDNDKKGDFIAVIYGDQSKVAANTFIDYAQKYGVPALPAELTEEYMQSTTFADLRRSDHAAYWSTGFPGIMLTDTANFRNTNYHCIGGPDTVDRLDHTFTMAIIKTTIAATVDLLRADSAAAVSPKPYACSLDKQDCPAGERCSAWSTGRRWMPTCMKLAAKTVGLNAACERPTGKLGVDNCAKDLFCSPWGAVAKPAGQRLCVRVCSTNAVCGKGTHCVVMSHRAHGSGYGPADVGLCLKSCDPFAKDACGADLMCSNSFTSVEGLFDTYTCMAAGKIEEGKSCRANIWGQCQPGLDCVFGAKGEAATCRKPCDAKHPCKTGSCVGNGYMLPAGSGQCMP